MRKISISRYWVAFLLTTIIFLGGLGFGLYMDQKKIEYVEKIAEKQKAELQSLRLQYFYLDLANDSSICPLIKQMINDNLEIIHPVLQRLIDYAQSGNLKGNPDYKLTKRKYTVANLRYWILAKKYREECEADLVPILYFYRSRCKKCKDQGYILTNLRRSFPPGKILVFPTDGGFKKELSIKVLLKSFDVKSYPTLVIGENVVRDFSSRPKLLGLICPLFSKRYKPCLP